MPAPIVRHTQSGANDRSQGGHQGLMTCTEALVACGTAT